MISLDATALADGGVVEAVGVPVYVDDVAQYAAWGLTETGWYVFARITGDGMTVTADTTVQGAAGVISAIGDDHVDVAVRFGTTAQSVRVVVDWGGHTDALVFRASDLAVRNLDYRTTFYLYDAEEFAHWTYALTTDATFTAGKLYYTLDGDEYALAEVTAGASVPANTYYTHTKLRFEGLTRNVTYRLDTIVDCPIEIALPEVDDGGYGCWFELQTRFDGSYSITLIPPTGSDVKIGTAQTQAQTAGINVIDLQYTCVAGARLWTLLNTHSNIPA